MQTKVEKKIKSLNQLSAIISKLKQKGKKIVLCHGVFDLIHPGHVRHLKSAKKSGDVLIGTVTADKFVKKGPGRPIFKQELRAEVLASIQDVDYVAIVDSESAVPAILKIQPDFFVKGPDYKGRKRIAKIPRKLGSEEKAVRTVGGKLIFSDDDIIFSSSKIISDYLEVYPAKTKKYLDILKNKYTAEKIVDKLSALSSLRILLIGDAIIDQYHYCLPMGKSSKEPVMVHQYIEDESFTGGTLATANHISTLTKNIRLITLLGKKESYEKFISNHLKPQIKPKFFYREDGNTIIKRRYLDFYTSQKLFQVSFLKDELIPENLESQIIKFINNEIKKYELVIVNDYGHGLLTDKIIKLICQRANYLALNVQANSANYGFNVITKYPRANFICIDSQEIRLATHDKYNKLPLLIKKIYNKMKCQDLIVTKGYEGSISFSKNEGFHETPSLTDKVVDRVGAGDALFAFTAPCMYLGFDRDLVSFIGNVAGALQVQTVGNREPVDFVDMARFITRLLK